MNIFRSSTFPKRVMGENCTSTFPKPERPLKGVKGENCNVTHCQEPKSANHFNSVTKAWYCIDCARRIERAAKADGMSFYSDLEAVGQ